MGNKPVYVVYMGLALLLAQFSLFFFSSQLTLGINFFLSLLMYALLSTLFDLSLEKIYLLKVIVLITFSVCFMQVWTVSSGFCFVTFSEHTNAVTALYFMARNHCLLSASLDGTVRAWDLFRYRNFRTFTTPSSRQFVSLAADQSGEVICAGTLDSFEVFWCRVMLDVNDHNCFVFLNSFFIKLLSHSLVLTLPQSFQYVFFLGKYHHLFSCFFSPHCF